MALLDRFRAQPRQKHEDPAIRLAFVQDIPLDERELLVEMAREDADPRVRRAAVAKIMDPGALASIAKADADESVRTQALSMLRDIALEAFEGIGGAEGLAAVDALGALSEIKTLAVVAKGAPSEPVAARALAGIADQHVLGSVARHAEHESVRRAAFAGLTDRGEVLSLALNSDFRDPTVEAVDRIEDRHELDQIANRARNKSAAKRARTLIREMDERGEREKDAAATALATTAAVAAEAAQAARAEAAAEASAPAPAALEREAARVAAERAAAVAAEEAVAERARQAAARERERQEAAIKAAERSRIRLTELAEEAARATAIDDLASARRQLTIVSREWQEISGHVAPEPELAARYAEIEQAFAVRDAAAREADQKARRDALSRLQQLATRLETLAVREDLTLKVGERSLRDVRAALGTIPLLPSKKEYDEIVRRLKAVQTGLMPKVQELRDVAGWQRWANVGIQEQLCEKMEALKTIEDPELIARQVKDLQQQWRQAADVPRAQGEVLWRRFKTAHDEAWARCEAHFAGQAEERAGNLEKKLALCSRAEALADSTSWIQTAEEIKKLQADWKTIGPVSRGQEKAIWERFRSGCDRFFTRRHADLAQRKALWSENLAKKEALCARAEALADSIEWDAASAEIKRLQAEWKTIGPVKKSRSEAMWLRFRGACDRFFTRYTQRHDVARAERVAAREAICAELEGLAGSPSPTAGDGGSPPERPHAPLAEALEAPADVVARVRSLRSKWQLELAARGVDRERAAELDARYAAAFGGVIARWPAAFSGTDLDPDANRKRMDAIVRRMEDLANSLAGSPDAADPMLSPTNRLAAMLKEALASNTIGGKVDNESRFRAANEEVRQAQANWSRIGPVPDDARRALADRFQRAIRRIGDAAGQAGRAGGPAQAGSAGRVGQSGSAGGSSRGR
jgi:hypothetical protein